MGRLTNLLYDGEYSANENADYDAWNCVNKLGRLEDLEEQGRLIEQKHGKWEESDDYVSENLWHCSECGDERYFEDGTPFESNVYYCPNCGAKMVEEVKLKELKEGAGHEE